MRDENLLVEKPIYENQVTEYNIAIANCKTNGNTEEAYRQTEKRNEVLEKIILPLDIQEEINGFFDISLKQKDLVLENNKEKSHVEIIRDIYKAHIKLIIESDDFAYRGVAKSLLVATNDLIVRDLLLQNKKELSEKGKGR